MSDGASQKDEIDPSSAKKIKISPEIKNDVVADELELKDFLPEKIVNNNTNRKTVCIKGTFKGKSGVALVVFEKNAFKEEDLDAKGYFSVDTEVHRFFQNDIYGNYECFPKASINGVKSTIIYPATEKHIEKFAIQEHYLILETPELYESCTLPQILKAECNLQWVYNILDGKSEQDRIVHNNPDKKEGFVLVPDLKWDGVTKETLYLLALVQPRDIKSLRDLDGRHLPLLKRVRDEGKKAIFQKYGVPGNQLRIYFHYQPSFYHLHIHFNSLKHDAPGIYADRAHLLDTVINNIEMMNDYYKKAAIPFTVREMDMFFNVYETNGYVQRNKSDNIELIDK
ncbi:m7GpppX diphosphatase [Epargyreus clarus]|uniref:m7GpppX diphosphatase n=1 Tax=Epargyreus clarus TaxID=520877 RepID=UPI003C3019FB